MWALSSLLLPNGVSRPYLMLGLEYDPPMLLQPGVCEPVHVYTQCGAHMHCLNRCIDVLLTISCALCLQVVGRVVKQQCRAFDAIQSPSMRCIGFICNTTCHLSHAKATFGGP
jgi:hypothetical protein